MTKESKIMLLLDKRDEALRRLNMEYASSYTVEGISLDEKRELNYWHCQEKDKIEKEFIKGILEM